MTLGRPKSKTTKKKTLAPRPWRVLQDCIEGGLRGGFWNELPESWDGIELDEEMVDHLVEKFQNRIMNEIDEYFRFD